MTNPDRPDPDALLAAIKKTEHAHKRGRLKIFFGMSAGVGKTYAMLEAARALKLKGTDVVIGLIETHGRRETEALLEGLPAIPRVAISHSGVSVLEMDLDEILRRRPACVLVDELAHSNTEGMRHAKRYQDVVEILDNGINVLTTLNVQHVESLVDTVQQISGITVRETVPDGILDAADVVELVDLAPDELLTRLAEGKVYAPDRSAAAAVNFFRKGNLTALREIALRKTADHVDVQMRDYMQEHRISGPWKTVERLMVAIGPSPYSEQLIRWTRRIAATMEAPWIAVYVQTPRPLSPEAEKRLKKNIALSQELGATLVSTADEDIVRAIIREAKRNNVTQIVIGKSMTSHLRDLFHGGSLVNRLIAGSGGVDIYVVQSDTGAPARKARATGIFSGIYSPLRHYVGSCAVALAAAFVCFMASDFIDYRSIGMFLLFVITMLSLFVGRGPLVIAAALSAVSWDYFFIPPKFTFSISHASDVVLVSLYFLVALVSGTLTARIRTKETVVRRRERHTSALYSFVNQLSATENIDDIADAGIKNLSAVFNAHVAIFLPTAEGATLDDPHAASTFIPGTEKEKSVAEWVFANKQPAGAGTTTLPFADAVYYPLLIHADCRGVAGLRFQAGATVSTETQGLLMMFLHQWAFSIDRAHLRVEAEHALLLKESERLNKTLLNSISHELRTPLATITGASSGLEDPAIDGDKNARKVLVSDIRSAAGRLNRLVENLLDMTRIESGRLSLSMEWCDIHDLVNAVIADLKDDLNRHDVSVSIAPDLPLVKLDTILVQQALSNILLNAVQYTPAKTKIRFNAYCEAETLVFSIEDDGPGIPKESMDRIFEKFYRVPGSVSGGTGLGLSIVKGFIEAHGGSVEASGRPAGGVRFLLRLPVENRTFAEGEAP
jgi:two-component system sensor histidine kinase KdpD